MRKAVFARIGAARLVRATTMSLIQDGVQWRFEGFEVSDAAKGTISPIDIANLDSGARAALRIENPKTRDVETTSCVSCHAAGPALRRAENSFGVSFADAPEAYQNANFDLSTPFAGTDTNQLRGFGWFFTQPQVSARVVNDSAEVVSFLRARRKSDSRLHGVGQRAQRTARSSSIASKGSARTTA